MLVHQETNLLAPPSLSLQGSADVNHGNLHIITGSSTLDGCVDGDVLSLGPNSSVLMHALPQGDLAPQPSANLVVLSTQSLLVFEEGFQVREGCKVHILQLLSFLQRYT